MSKSRFGQQLARLRRLPVGDEHAPRRPEQVARREELHVHAVGHRRRDRRLVAEVALGDGGHDGQPPRIERIEPGEEDAFVAGLDLADLIGVGPALREALSRRGVVDMAGLRSIDQETLASWLGPERGAWLWRRCRGIDGGAVHGRDSARSVSSETTFGRDSEDRAYLEGALLGRVVSAAGSLRKQGLFARTITVKLRDSEFRDRSRSRTLRAQGEADRPTAILRFRWPRWAW